MPNRDTPPLRPDRSWSRFAAVFVLLFVLYQASESLQTRFAPGHAAGPALMFAMLLVAWPLGRWLGWRGYDAYALDLRPASLWLLLAGLVVAVAAKMLTLQVGKQLGILAAADQVAHLSLSWAALALLTTFVPSIAEDILTRGIVLRSLPSSLGPWSFVLLSALLYTANHLWRFDWGWTEQFRLFCLGLAYAAAAWRWQTLWAAVALHWGWNLGSALADGMLPVDVVDVPGFRLISAGAHLLLLVLVLLLPRRAGRA
jgi:uncharacterized protein